MGRAHTMHVFYEEFMTPPFFYPLPQSPDTDGEAWAFPFFLRCLQQPFPGSMLNVITKKQRLFTSEEIEGSGMPNTPPHTHIRDSGLSRQELSLNFCRSSAMDASFH